MNIVLILTSILDLYYGSLIIIMTLYSFASITKLWGKLDKINFNGQKSCWYESSGIKMNLVYVILSFSVALFLEILMGFVAQAILRWYVQNNDDCMIWFCIICFSLQSQAEVELRANTFSCLWNLYLTKLNFYHLPSNNHWNKISDS